MTGLILTDTNKWTEKFHPIVDKQPMSLAPLINISIIEFQINYLMFNNINPIYIFTGTKHVS